jgi:predicted XRE-type DNA-binding protein
MTGEKTTEIVRGSGNVFADLELDDADELYARAQIGFQVYQILQERKLKQREIAMLLAIKQPEVSHLMNGHFHRFTIDKLLIFLKKLEWKVTLQIEPRQATETHREVTLAL